MALALLKAMAMIQGVHTHTNYLHPPLPTVSCPVYFEELVRTRRLGRKKRQKQLWGDEGIAVIFLEEE